MELVLKLGNTTGDAAISEKLGHSTVASWQEKIQNRDRHQSVSDWAASLKMAVYLIGKELTMKKNVQKFHITNAILWAHPTPLQPLCCLPWLVVRDRCGVFAQ